MTGTGQQQKNQINRFRENESSKNLDRKTSKKKKLIANRDSRLAVDKRTQIGQQKVNNETLCSAVIEMNK